jgi:hypothetical protein
MELTIHTIASKTREAHLGRQGSQINQDIEFDEKQKLASLLRMLERVGNFCVR